MPSTRTGSLAIGLGSFVSIACLSPCPPCAQHPELPAQQRSSEPELHAQSPADRFSPAQRPSMQASDGELDGEWAGSLAFIAFSEAPGGTSKPTTVRVVIAGSVAHAYLQHEADWREVKPGRFLCSQHGVNGTVSAIDDGVDADGRWVETWTLTLTKTSPDSARVVLLRMVNNLDRPRTQKQATWWLVAAGELSATGHREPLAPASIQD